MLCPDAFMLLLQGACGIGPPPVVTVPWAQRVECLIDWLLA